MKLRITLFVLIFGLFSNAGIVAQSGNNKGPVIPLQTNKSILFGTDKYISSQPLQNQRNIVICSAFNGWLYCVYSYFNPLVLEPAVTLLRSQDNGVTWSVILNGTLGFSHSIVTRLDILACGHDTANLKVFIGYCVFDSSTIRHTALVARYNGNTGHVEENIFNEDSWYIRDLALASDDLYPATNSNPYSIAVVYSKWNNSDSIVFLSSSNGGMSFNNQCHIASSSHYFDKVALTYGRSPSCNSGRYFAAWEEQDNANSTSGHIYTAHSEPNFNSPFTVPVLLDSLDVSTANKASNPVIACQNNGADNDSSNLTEVVLFEKYQPASQNFNIAGVYNKKATNSSNFRKFSLNASPNNIKQPDIAFNPYDSTFMVTWFDSAAQKLPYYIHDYNMTDPDAWDWLSGGYNDDNNLASPHPQVAIDFGKHAGVNVWSGQRETGNGAAMFDSPFTYYVGEPETGNDKTRLKVNIFPNPAAESATIEFDLPGTGNVKVDLVNSLGQTLTRITDTYCKAGRHRVKADLSMYPEGIYIVAVHANELFFFGKVAVGR